MPESPITAHARSLIEYDAWAMRLVLDAASKLSDEQLDRSNGASQDSIRGTLKHMLAAQMAWLRRIDALSEADAPSLDDLASAFRDANAALLEFAATVDDAAWQRIINYRNNAGEPKSAPLGVLLTHMVNHGTHHRAEVGLWLAAAGHAPGDMDYVFFELERTGQR